MRYLLIGLSCLLFAVADVFGGVQISHPPEPGLIVTNSNQSGNSPAAVLQSDSAKTATSIPKFADIGRQTTIFRQMYIAYQLAASSDVPTLKSHMDNLIRDDDPFFHYNIADVFLERLIELDVMESIHYIKHARISQQRIHRYLSNIVSIWIRHDPEAAIDYIRKIDSQQLKSMIGARILNDPTLSIKELQSELRQDLGHSAWSFMITEQLNQKDPEVVFEEALLLRGNDRRTSMWSAVTRWYKEDPEALLARISDIADPVEKKNVMQMLINTQSQQDPFAAFETVQNYYPQDTDMMQPLLMAMAFSNIRQALPYIKAFVERTGDTHILRTIGHSWSQDEPLAAIDYANTLDKQYRLALLNGIASGYIGNHPDEGLRWAMSHNDREVLEYAINILPSIDVPMAEDLLKQLDDPKHYNNLIRRISEQKAQADPESAFQWLANYQDEPGYHNAFTQIIYVWARHDPKSAAVTLEKHKEDSDYQELFNNVAQNWAQRDPKEAIKWVRSLPKGKILDQAAQFLVWQIWRHDIDSAINMMDAMSDEQSSNVRMSIALDWQAQNPDEIEDIVDKLDLTEEQADRLR